MPRSEDWKWRLATTEAGLAKGSLAARGIPGPTQAPFEDFTTRNSRGTGGTAHHGFIHDELLWVRLTNPQLYWIRQIVDGVGTGLIYATVKRDDGYKPGGLWVDVSAYPDLEVGGPEQPQSGVSGNVTVFVSNVLLRLNNITVLTEDPF